MRKTLSGEKDDNRTKNTGIVINSKKIDAIKKLMKDNKIVIPKGKINKEILSDSIFIYLYNKNLIKFL